MSTQTIAVIGGGIGGLASAFRIKTAADAQKKGSVDVRVYESSNRVGGVIQTERSEGFLMELGPDCFITDKQEALQLAIELGLEDEIIPTNPKFRQSFILKGNRLIRVPEGLYLMAPARWTPFAFSPLLSIFGKARAAMEPFVPRRMSDSDESLASFVRRRLGQEVLDRIAQPMIAGIYAADPETLSLDATMPRFRQMERDHGSVIRALRKRRKSTDAASGPRYGLFASFKNGMSTLTDELERRLKGSIETNARVLRVRRETPRGWRITMDSREPVSADAVILALPAHRIAEILPGAPPEICESLRNIRYSTTTTVNLAYRKEDLLHPLNGMGFVIPSVENRMILGCTFASTKFQNRAPEDHVLIRAFVADHHNETNDEGKLIKQVESELKQILHIKASAIHTRATRWEKSLPQYSIGHQERVHGVKNYFDSQSDLLVVGNAWEGIGIPDVIRSANVASDRILNLFSRASCPDL